MFAQFSSALVNCAHELLFPQLHLPGPPKIKEINSEDNQQARNHLHPESAIPGRGDGESQSIFLALVSVAIPGLHVQQIVPLIERPRSPNRRGRNTRPMITGSLQLRLIVELVANTEVVGT